MKRLLALNMLPASGGTIVSRYLASRGWLLNSEIHPYANRSSDTFCPNKFSDILITQIEAGLGASMDTRLFRQKSFLTEIELSIEIAEFYNKPLALRCWHHPNFTQDEPLLSDSVSQVIATSQIIRLSELVVVRNPIDNYLSFIKNADWARYVSAPDALDQFMKRYLCFVEFYAKRKATFITYEEFCTRPEDFLHIACDLAQHDVQQLVEIPISKIKMSGSSGRQSDTIEVRPREKLNYDVEKKLNESIFYRKIISLLPCYEEKAITTGAD